MRVKLMSNESGEMGKFSTSGFGISFGTSELVLGNSLGKIENPIMMANQQHE
jgi:hypothetical protein